MRRALLTLVVLACLGGVCSAPEPSSAPSPVDDFVLVHNVRYRDGDNPLWTLDIAYPEAPADDARPAVVVIHGGGWLEGDKSSFSTIENRPPGNIIDLARHGYVAATINYRLSGEAPFPAALDDCRAAVQWLQKNAATYALDPKRIGVWGNSAGGHLALLLALDEDADSPRIRAAVSDSGPLDLVHQARHGDIHTAVERFLGGPPDADRLPAYQRASPVCRLSEKCPPLLLIYGGADTQVPVETADAFLQASCAAGARDVTYLRLSTANHCPHSLERIGWVDDAITAFFDRTLKERPPGCDVDR